MNFIDSFISKELNLENPLHVRYYIAARQLLKPAVFKSIVDNDKKTRHIRNDAGKLLIEFLDAYENSLNEQNDEKNYNQFNCGGVDYILHKKIVIDENDKFAQHFFPDLPKSDALPQPKGINIPSSYKVKNRSGNKIDVMIPDQYLESLQDLINDAWSEIRFEDTSTTTGTAEHNYYDLKMRFKDAMENEREPHYILFGENLPDNADEWNRTVNSLLKLTHSSFTDHSFRLGEAHALHELIYGIDNFYKRFPQN